MRWLVLAVVPSLLLSLSPAASARPLYVCERPDGALLVTRAVNPDTAAQPAIAARLHEANPSFPSPTSCWWMDSAGMPDRYRVDPREPGERIPQRHRWRRGPGDTVIADPTVLRPDRAAVMRAFAAEFPAARRAAILATNLGSNLHQAIRDGDWALAKALLAQIAAKSGGPDQIMTPPEIATIRAIGREYEADLD